MVRGKGAAGGVGKVVALEADVGAGAFDGFGIGEDARFDYVILQVLRDEDLIEEDGFDFDIFGEVVFFAAPFVVFGTGAFDCGVESGRFDFVVEVVVAIGTLVVVEEGFGGIEEESVGGLIWAGWGVGGAVFEDVEGAVVGVVVKVAQ